MTVVRELITVLGFQVDKAGYDKAAKQYDALRGHLTDTGKAATAASGGIAQAAKATSGLGAALGMVQRFAATAGLSAMLKQFVTLASDANETRSALGALFGPEAVAQVDEWSRAQGEAMGRSQYDLQSYVARLGSVLGPVTSSREEALRMSQSLSQLAVDLGSFFNTTDTDAMQALRSGLTGEYESLKRYGVVLNDATLTEIAHARGIRKKITQMTVAEKTELRYAAIMARTTAAQGDAQRTGEGYANSMKAIEASLKDIGIGMAKTVVPVLEKVTRAVRDGLKWFNEMAKGSNVLEAAFWTLAAVVAVLGAEFYAAFILPAIAIGALVLLVDELLTLFRGGKTAIGEFVNAIAGAGAAESWVLNQIAGWQILGEWIESVWNAFTSTWAAAGGFSGIVDGLVAAYEYLGVLLGDLAAKFSDWLLTPIRKLQEGLAALGIKTGPMLQELSYERATGPGLTDDRVMGFREYTARREQERKAARGAAASDFGSSDLKQRRYATGRGLGAEATTGAGIAAVSGAPTASLPTTAAPATVSAPAGGGAGAAGTAPASVSGGAAQPAAGPVVVPVNAAAPTIIINGDNPAKTRQVVLQALEDDRKKQMAALARQGGS